MVLKRPPLHQRSLRCCWARNVDGSPCCKDLGTLVSRPEQLPYCERHLRLGDEAFQVRAHPNPDLGKVLCARTALPAGYRLVYWGRQCMDTKKFIEGWARHLRGESSDGQGFFPEALPMADGTLKEKDYILDTEMGVAVHPGASRAMCRGSIAQYASMPGPDEDANLAALPAGDFPRAQLVGQRLAGVCLATLEPVAAGTQVAWFYVRGNRGLSNRWLRKKGGVKPVNMGWPRAPLPPRQASVTRASAKKTKKHNRPRATLKKRTAAQVSRGGG
mmetsp:Transcript_29282/g.51244  ORF Transcript_29282/g.51244 Transcript_29282/m.51244 type:complete len:274 (-) Transcript_29282:126-947(-)